MFRPESGFRGLLVKVPKQDVWQICVGAKELFSVRAQLDILQVNIGLFELKEFFLCIYLVNPRFILFVQSRRYPVRPAIPDTICVLW